MAEENVPDFIELFYAKQKKADRIIATAQHHHTKAYQKAVDEHLLDDNGEVDHQKLEDENFHGKFVDTLTDHYKSRIIEELNIKVPEFKNPEDEQFYNDRLLQLATGQTKAQILERVKKNKSKYTADEHSKYAQSHIEKELSPKIQASIGDHITKDHIDDIVTYTLGDKKDMVNTKLMDVNDANSLLLNYKQGEHEITRSMLKDTNYLVKEED